ncbi:autotransporter domain-containing protein [Roseateles terrae]|uniref:Autotransporter domain-containing protein n=1 Tax=Roseateles terrae TaxID=431060 RepID=A0ABR6GPY4_9BURK|nr:autotransporter domain-containing protein [Roseateles terrae]MBB3193243.1 hypothetical protein [Roseateles terrae]
MDNDLPFNDPATRSRRVTRTRSSRKADVPATHRARLAPTGQPLLAGRLVVEVTGRSQSDRPVSGWVLLSFSLARCLVLTGALEGDAQDIPLRSGVKQVSTALTRRVRWVIRRLNGGLVTLTALSVRSGHTLYRSLPIPEDRFRAMMRPGCVSGSPFEAVSSDTVFYGRAPVQLCADFQQDQQHQRVLQEIARRPAAATRDGLTLSGRRSSAGRLVRQTPSRSAAPRHRRSVRARELQRSAISLSVCAAMATTAPAQYAHAAAYPSPLTRTGTAETALGATVDALGRQVYTLQRGDNLFAASGPWSSVGGVKLNGATTQVVLQVTAPALQQAGAQVAALNAATARAPASNRVMGANRDAGGSSGAGGAGGASSATASSSTGGTNTIGKSGKSVTSRTAASNAANAANTATATNGKANGSGVGNGVSNGAAVDEASETLAFVAPSRSPLQSEGGRIGLNGQELRPAAPNHWAAMDGSTQTPADFGATDGLSAASLGLSGTPGAASVSPTEVVLTAGEALDAMRNLVLRTSTWNAGSVSNSASRADESARHVWATPMASRDRTDTTDGRQYRQNVTAVNIGGDWQVGQTGTGAVRAGVSLTQGHVDDAYARGNGIANLTAVNSHVSVRTKSGAYVAASVGAGSVRAVYDATSLDQTVSSGKFRMSTATASLEGGRPFELSRGLTLEPSASVVGAVMLKDSHATSSGVLIETRRTSFGQAKAGLTLRHSGMDDTLTHQVYARAAAIRGFGKNPAVQATKDGDVIGSQAVVGQHTGHEGVVGAALGVGHRKALAVSVEAGHQKITGATSGWSGMVNVSFRW